MGTRPVFGKRRTFSRDPLSRLRCSPSRVWLLAAPARNTQPGNLVAAYAFDEGSGSSVADLSGNGNTGQVGSATWTSAGKFGSALSFDGSSSRVRVDDSASLDLTSAVTLEAWVYPAVAQSGWRAVVQKETDSYLLHASSGAGG